MQCAITVDHNLKNFNNLIHRINFPPPPILHFCFPKASLKKNKQIVLKARNLNVNLKMKQTHNT